MLTIRGARVIDPSSGFDRATDMTVDDGRIAGFFAGDGETIDASGLVLAPGLVDMHVHLREPGLSHKETIETGCRAAAAGGVTSLLAMPNTKPVADSPDTVRWILDRAKGMPCRVFTTAAITSELAGGTLTDFAALKAAGAIALTDDGRPVENDNLMRNALMLAARLNLLITSHCEDLSLSAGGLMNEGEIARSLGIRGIPRSAEDHAVAREISLAESEGVRVHIAHVSTRGSVQLVREAKKRGAKVTAETAPHYFSLTEQALQSQNANFRMNPPLGDESDRLAVIKGLQDGTIDAIATDHAPHSPEEKADFLTAPNGVIGLETSLAVGITYLVEAGLLSLSALIAKMSTVPAAILGIEAGNLRIGAPADLVLFDPSERWTVRPPYASKSANTPYEGSVLTGRVRMTLQSGNIVYKL